jgi:hypothetical protein
MPAQKSACPGRISRLRRGRNATLAHWTGAPSHEGARLLFDLGCATLLGVLLNFISVDPTKALFYSAVVNSVIAVPIMAIVMLLAVKPAVMGRLLFPSLFASWDGSQRL